MRAHKSSGRIVFAALVIAGILFTPACGDLPTESNLSDTPADSPASETSESSQKLANLAKAGHFDLVDTEVDSSASKLGLFNLIDLVVGFRDTTVSGQEMAMRYEMALRYEYDTVFPGMAASVSLWDLLPTLLRMQKDPDVVWVEPDLSLNVVDELLNTSLGVLSLTTSSLFGLLSSKQVVPWGIDAIDADRSWTRSGDGRRHVDVDVYILDTGAKHSDLRVDECLDFTKDRVRSCGLISDLDLNAHGTATAGVAAAEDNREGSVGVAPGARVHAMKVLNDDGTAPFSRVIAAIEYLTERKLKNPSEPIVANVSLGANLNTTALSSLDRALAASIDAGVIYVVAAGNDGVDVRTVTPARVPDAITVGAYDNRSRFFQYSNYGSQVDILAPGKDVEVLTSGNAVRYASGTSIAAPFVTGAAALLLAHNPRLSPRQVQRELVRRGRSNVQGVPRNTTNVSLYVRYLR